jgi:hypothetical protein
VVVRWPGGAENVVIKIETDKANKQLNRDPQEPVHKALARLQTSLASNALFFGSQLLSSYIDPSSSVLH